MAKLTPIKAIRAKCMNCSGNQFVEVRECPVTDCALYEYRMGHRPPKEDLNTLDDEITTKDI